MKHGNTWLTILACVCAVLIALAGLATQPAVASTAVAQATTTPVSEAGATVTATVPVTVTPVLTATVTPVVTATSTPEPYTSVAFIDDFQAKCQLAIVDEDDRAFGCADGEYSMLVKKGGFIWRAAYRENYADGVISVEARAPTGDTGIEYGLAFRISSDGYYFFSVSPKGEYGFYQYSPTKKWSTYIKSTPSDLVKKGAEKNRLQVIMQGTLFALYVNDQYLDTVTDLTLTNGTVALVTSSDNDNGQVYIDNVIISKINRPLPLSAGKPKPPSQAGLPEIPEGMGALIVYNYYGREVNFDIAGKLYKVPANGNQVIFLPPGKHNWSADIPGLGRAGGSTEISVGRYNRQSFAN